MSALRNSTKKVKPKNRREFWQDSAFALKWTYKEKLRQLIQYDPGLLDGEKLTGLFVVDLFHAEPMIYSTQAQLAEVRGKNREATISAHLTRLEERGHFRIERRGKCRSGDKWLSNIIHFPTKKVRNALKEQGLKRGTYAAPYTEIDPAEVKKSGYSGDGGQAFHLKADSDSGRSRTAFR